MTLQKRLCYGCAGYGTLMRRLPWSSASSWPTRPESDGGTGPGACSHTACRTSWCRKDCSPDRRGSKSPLNCLQFYTSTYMPSHNVMYFKLFYLISNKTLHSMIYSCFGNAEAQESAPTNTLSHPFIKSIIRPCRSPGELT